MEVILHKYSDLPSCIINLICEYHTTYVEDKIRGLYLDLVKQTWPRGLSLDPYTQLKYLNTLTSDNDTFELKQYIALNYGNKFLLTNKHLIQTVDYEFFKTIYTSNNTELYDIKINGKGMSDYPELAKRCQEIVEESVEEPPIKINYTNVKIKEAIKKMDYNELRQIANLSKYKVPDIMLEAIISDLKMALLFVPQIKKRLETFNRFMKQNLSRIVCLNIPEINNGIDFNFCEKLINITDLLRTYWFRAELYNYHKHGIETPITRVFNLNVSFDSMLITVMYQFLQLSELEFYYNNADKKNKLKMMLIPHGKNASYMINKYYTGNDTSIIERYGNIKYYDWFKLENLSRDVLFNPHINQIIKYIEN